MASIQEVEKRSTPEIPLILFRRGVPFKIQPPVSEDGQVRACSFRLQEEGGPMKGELDLGRNAAEIFEYGTDQEFNYYITPAGRVTFVENSVPQPVVATSPIFVSITLEIPGLTDEIVKARRTSFLYNGEKYPGHLEDYQLEYNLVYFPFFVDPKTQKDGTLTLPPHPEVFNHAEFLIE